MEPTLVLLATPKPAGTTPPGPTTGNQLTPSGDRQTSQP
jgi:hypothetical protein